MEDDIEVEVSVPLLISVEEMTELSIGSLNLTQVLQTLFTAMSPFFDNIQTFISIFAHAQPTWHCTTTTTNMANRCISNKSDVCRLSKSEWAWDYHDLGINTSIVSEWGLECASSLITGFPTTCYFVGCLLGGLVLATLGDSSSLGRKNLLCISSLVMSLAAFASAFSPNIWVYSMLRFVCGVGRAPLATCALVLFTERVPKQWRSHATMVGCISASLGILGLAFVAYLAKESSWKILYLWTSIPGIVFSISAFFLMHESPRWLFLQGRNQDAIDSLTSLGNRRISHTNSSKITIVECTKQIKESNNSSPFSPLKIIIDRKWAVIRLVGCMLLAFGIGVMYFGMFLGVGVM